MIVFQCEAAQSDAYKHSDLMMLNNVTQREDEQVFGRHFNQFLTIRKPNKIDSLRKLSTDVPDLLRPERKHPKPQTLSFYCCY